MHAINTGVRKSRMELGLIYFWTATIHKSLPLLHSDAHKQYILDSLAYLSTQQLIDVFAFVIMPNHIHLIWQLKRYNGKELPSASLLKFTAHHFLKELKHSGGHKQYIVEEANRMHRIWQDDSLAYEINSRGIAKQKLNDIHQNPVSDKWMLVRDARNYHFSSIRFYENPDQDFGFLKDIFLVLIDSS